MKSYCTVFALLGLSAPALAQEPSGRPDPWLLPYPTGYVTGSANQACIGRFTDDLVTDGALLSGGNVFLLYAPDRVCSYSKSTGPFSSMAKVNVSGCPAPEGLLVSSSAGLVLLQWDDMRVLEATAVSNSSAWANAEQLQVIPSSTGSQQWICALSSAHDAVLYARWNGAAFSSNSAGVFDLEAPAVTLAALDWDGDAALDFAVDGGSGVRVFEAGGTEALYSLDNASSGPQLLRLHSGGGDDLIWLTQNPYGSDLIQTVIHSSDGSLEVPLFCTAASVGRLTLIDVDRDGQLDLVATRADDDTALVLFHQSEGDEPSFGLYSPLDGLPLVIGLDDVYGTSNAVPAVAAGDLDGDGDDDLLFAGQPGSANTALLWFGTNVNELAPTLEDPYVIVKAWVTDVDYVDWMWPNEPPDEDVAHLSLYPWGLPSEGPAATATDIRVTVWTRETETGLMESQSLVDTFEDPASWPIIVDLPLPELGSGDQPPQFLVLQVSFVRRDLVDGTILQAFPAWTGQFDRALGLPKDPEPGVGAGSTTTGGVNQPPPPSSNPPPSP